MSLLNPWARRRIWKNIDSALGTHIVATLKRGNAFAAAQDLANHLGGKLNAEPGGDTAWMYDEIAPDSLDDAFRKIKDKLFERNFVGFLDPLVTVVSRIVTDRRYRQPYFTV